MTDLRPSDVVRYDVDRDSQEPVSPAWAKRDGREFVVVAPGTSDDRVAVWDPEFNDLSGNGDAIYPKANRLTLVARAEPVDGPGSLLDLKERAEKASRELRALADKENPGQEEWVRLLGKREGVDLVLSYIDDALRIQASNHQTAAGRLAKQNGEPT